VIRPGVEYTREEVAAFRNSSELADVLLRGYVFTLTVGGNFMLVPWNQASGGGYGGDSSTSFGVEKTQSFDTRELPPIVRRTPQERLNSLMDKVGEDLRFILSGQAGHEVTGEEARTVARQHLQEADDEFEQKQEKLITREDGSWYR
jgi:hypothetical protein